MHFIYLTTNTINGKRYVGKTNGKNPKYLGSGLNLDRAIKKYGIENFVREILEEADESVINEREVFWIAKLKPEYNIAEGGSGGNTAKYMTEEQRKDYFYKKGKGFRNNNPMHDPRVKKLHSDRMKKNNPMQLYPDKNHTAKPIVVQYLDGTVEYYSYAKKLTLEKNIPYDTVKYLMRMKKSSSKHNIQSIKQILREG